MFWVLVLDFVRKLNEVICERFRLSRYGYRPIPSEIDTAELELLRDALVSMGNDVALLDKWYRKDNNKVGEKKDIFKETEG